MRPERLAAILLLCCTAVIESCDPAFSPTTAKTFRADLNGTNVKPTAITTAAVGTATFTVGDTAIAYTLNVTSLANITSAHIHLGGAAVGGPMVVTLVATGTAPPGTFTGTLVSGSITAANVNPGVPISLASILSLMRNGDAYIDVHTSANPAGEIRGQIVATH